MNQFRPEAWLPTTKKEVEMRGWDYIDVILFNGDAYVDHPSFGGAVIGRTLEAEGLRVWPSCRSRTGEAISVISRS